MAHTRSDAKARTDVLDSLRTASAELEGEITEAEDRGKRDATAHKAKEQAMKTRFSAMRNRQ